MGSNSRQRLRMSTALHTHAHRHTAKTHTCLSKSDTHTQRHTHTAAETACLVSAGMKWCKMTSVAPVSACDSLHWLIKARHYHCWEWANRPGYHRAHHLNWTWLYWSPLWCEGAGGHCTGNECFARDKGVECITVLFGVRCWSGGCVWSPCILPA